SLPCVSSTWPASLLPPSLSSFIVDPSNVSCAASTTAPCTTPSKLCLLSFGVFPSSVARLLLTTASLIVSATCSPIAACKWYPSTGGTLAAIRLFLREVEELSGLNECGRAEEDETAVSVLSYTGLCLVVDNSP